ncbi:MAG TPA: hypothetical protein VGW10_00800, partial [Solirubrobacteraceae bacterium]|nr:hypothetical protein [Solirubrobacteraceae bacterium]
VKMGDGPKQIEAARIPEEVASAPPASLRLVRACRRPGRLRMRILGDARSVVFRAGRHTLRDARPPLARTLTRRRLQRTRARRLTATVSTPAGRVRLTRTLPRCGLG